MEIRLNISRIRIGNVAGHSLNLLPWKIPFPTSPPIAYPTNSMFSSNEINGTTAVNGRCDTEELVPSHQVSLNQGTSCIQNRSEGTWTKETVDAAVALTNMASLNTARRNIPSPEAINK